MINNKRPTTAYERELLELVRTKFKEALKQRLKNLPKSKETMTNPARQAFEDELRQLLIDSWQEKTISVSQAADRLIELARRVINEE